MRRRFLLVPALILAAIAGAYSQQAPAPATDHPLAAAIRNLTPAELGKLADSVNATLFTPILPPPPQQPAPKAKRLLTGADFTFAGVLKLPTDKTSTLAWNGQWPGLWLQDGGFPAIRRKTDGSKTFLLAGSHPAQGFGVVCEVALAAPALDPTQAVRGKLLNTWTAQQFFGVTTPADMTVYGIVPQQLYCLDDHTVLWLFSPYYNVTGYDKHTVLGLTTLNTDGTCTPSGPWAIAGGARRCGMYFCPVPAWLQSKVGGRTLAVGATAHTNGDQTCSFGPSLVAIDIPTPATLLGTVLGSAAITHYPLGNESLRGDGTTLIAARDGSIWNKWPQQEAVHSAVWIDTPTAHGFFAFGREALGVTFYGPSPFTLPDAAGIMPVYLPPNPALVDPVSGAKGSHATDYRQCWYSLDPGKFAANIDGTTPLWSIQPSYFPNPSQTFPLTDKYQYSRGAVYDPDDGSIYLAFSESLDQFNWLPMLVKLAIKQ